MQGWKTGSLESLCRVFSDGDWIEKKDQSANGIRLIQTGNVGIGEYKDREDKSRYISEEVFERLNCREVFQGDCLISRLPDPVGRSCIIPKIHNKLITAVDCTILRFNPEEIVPKFFNYYSQSTEYLKAVDMQCGGATRKRISRKKLGEIQVRYPSIQEQKRIVEILDHAFEGIDQAIQNTEKNLANARELFESKLNSIFSEENKGIETVKLGDVCKVIGGGTPSKQVPSFYLGNIPWATVRDMNAEVISKTEHSITEEAIKQSSTNLIPKGNVVIATRVGLGKVCLLDQDTAINQDLRGVIPLGESIDSSYLFWWFKSISKYIEKNGVGATVKGVKLPFIKGLDFPVIRIEEQQAVAKQVQYLAEGTKTLQGAYSAKLYKLQSLKQSLLEKAFSGELTADMAERNTQEALSA